MKPSGANYIKVDSKSPPLRGRGLKQDCGIERMCERAVAPLAGAWIETQ